MTDLLLFGDEPGPGNSGPADAVALDTETTGLHWTDDCLGVSLAWRDGAGDVRSCYAMDPRGSRQLPMWGVSSVIQAETMLAWARGARAIIMANHAFDYRVLLKAFQMRPMGNVIEIQHVARHLGPQAFGVSLSALYGKYVGKPDARLAEVKGQRANLKDLDPSLVADYARHDAVMTLSVYEAFKSLPTVGHYKRHHTWDQEFQELTMAMVQRGLPLDRAHIHERIRSYRMRMIEVGTQLVSWGIANPNFAPDVMGFCKSRNIPVKDTTAEELERFSKDYQELAAVVEYRQLGKALGSWLEDMETYGEWDGHLHSRLNPFGTRSYRMSSEDPNVQAIPMEERKDRAFGSMMGVFRSHREGQVLYAVDVKQAELRLASSLSGDQDLMDAVSSGDDPYTQLAVQIWGDRSQRYRAKQAMLAAVYEVGARKFSGEFGVTENEAGAILGQVRARFPTAMKRAKEWTHRAEQTGRIDLVSGRPRWIQDDERGHEYKAFNQFVQGSLAEIMHETMLRVERRMPGRLVNQIHDSLVLYMPENPDARTRDVAQVQECLDDSVRGLLGDAYRPPPFPIEPKPYEITKEVQ